MPAEDHVSVQSARRVTQYSDMKRLRSTFILLGTAVIWGLAFTAQREGAKYVGAFTFNAVRFALGALVLLPVILTAERKADKRKRLRSVGYGAAAGAFLFAAAVTQQFGIGITDNAGKSAFITGLYTVLVPIAYFIFFRRKTGINVIAGAVIAVAGLYLLCGSMGPLGIGDLLLFICAALWSAQIIWIDRAASKDVLPITFSAAEFAAASLACVLCAIPFETVSFGDIRAAAIPLLYAGIMSTGIAFTLQVVGQKNADPTIASIVMSTEAVWAAIGGAIIFHETMSAQGIVGCALMISGIIIAQLDLSRLIRKKTENDSDRKA